MSIRWDEVPAWTLIVATLAVIAGAVIWTAVWSVRTKASCMEACGTARLEFIDGVCHCATLDGYERAKGGE